MTERESGKHMCTFTIDVYFILERLYRPRCICRAHTRSHAGKWAPYYRFYRSGKEGCTRIWDRRILVVSEATWVEQPQTRPMSALC